jgi:hypothetical protein
MEGSFRTLSAQLYRSARTAVINISNPLLRNPRSNGLHMASSERSESFQPLVSKGAARLKTHALSKLRRRDFSAIDDVACN